MMLDKDSHDGNGHWHHPADHNGDIRGTKLARLRSRQLGHDPGTPGSWPLLLMAHARWILGVTLAAVAVAAVFTSTQTPLYASEADVVVQPAPAVAGISAQQPDMSTETGVATSGVVLSRAAQAVGVNAATLRNGLSVKALGAGYVLQFTYSAADRHMAQQRAQAIAQAYTSFRSASPSPRSAPQSTSPTATVITPASLPAAPYSPDYLLDIGAALLVGLALAIASAWGRDSMDDRLRGPFDLELQVGADVLGMIPAFRPAKHERRGQLAVAASPGSMVAEAYRALRTRVLLSAAGRNSGTILVTSAAWEDRGTVAANLAVAVAQSGRSTVLVCAGQQWGRAQLVVGVQEDAQGLTELLEKRADPLAALQSTSIPGLRLLLPGAAPPDPAALLQPPALRAALSEIRAHADVVVIEAPPLLVSSDARPLLGCAGMILLIADARASTRAQVRAAVRELEQDRARLAGCVLVNVGRRLRLRPEYLTSAQAMDDGPRSAPAGSGDVDLAPMPGAAPAGPGSQVTQERQWPNNS